MFQDSSVGFPSFAQHVFQKRIDNIQMQQLAKVPCIILSFPHIGE